MRKRVNHARHWRTSQPQAMPTPKRPAAAPAPSAVQVAQAATAQAFAKGTVPAPYYLFVLMRAQRKLAAHAVSTGCAGPKTAGGTVYVQRATAQAKGPTAVRCNVHRTVLVPTPGRTLHGRTKYVPVTVIGTVPIVP